MACKLHETHDHHVHPRYLGGSDERENRILLGDVSHTMWHWASWQRTGDFRERGAYLLLKGRLEKSTAKLWEDPIYKEGMRLAHTDRVARQMEDGTFSEMGRKGGSANARTSRKKAMANHKPERQKQLCLQQNPSLTEYFGKWLTFQHTSGSTYTTKFDYSLKPIVNQLSRLSGKRRSSSVWTKMITEGKEVSGWKLLKSL